MTNFELIKVFQTPMKMLMKQNIRLSDARFVELYEDYLQIIAGGYKMTYAVAVLAERYSISERKVYQLIRSMGEDCTFDAALVTPPT